MRVLVLLICCATFVSGCPAAQLRDHGGLPVVALELPPRLEADRSWYAERIASAERRVRAWFAAAGHSLAGQVLISRASVFTDLKAARPSLAASCGPLPERLPPTFSGTVCSDALIVIDRAAFRRNFEKLYPDREWRDDEYERLLTHELAHRGHALVARALFGSEDGMGPRWFFEGLAMACAGQFPGPAVDTDDRGVTRPMDYSAFARRAAEDGQKVLSYPIYASMFRYLAERIPAAELIREAGKPGFMAWLAERVGVDPTAAKR